jgi:hypothetical protein
VPGGYFTVEDIFVTVDPAKTRNGQILAILGIEEIVGGGAGVLAVDIGRDGPLLGQGSAVAE